VHTKFFFIKDGEGNRLETVTTDEEPILIVQSGRGTQIRKAKLKIIKIAEVMDGSRWCKLADYNKSMVMEWEEKKAKR